MIAWCAVAWADPFVDPGLEGALVAAGANVERGEAVWTMVVAGRPLVVPAPRNASEAAAIRALVESLASGLDLVPVAALPEVPPLAPPSPVERPVPRVPAPEPHPAPLPPAPIVVVFAAPPPPPPPAAAPFLAPWAGLELSLRPEVASAAGVAFGVTGGRQVGFGLRAAVRTPRALVAAPDARMFELTGDVEWWGAVGARARWSVSAGVAGRVVYQGTDVASAHALPRASAAVWFPASAGPITTTFAVGPEVDLARTELRRGDGTVIDVLSTVGVRIEARVSGRSEPDAPVDTEER